MNKSEIVAQAAKDSGLTQQNIHKAVEGFMKVISDAIIKGENVVLSGFGTFKVAHRKARNGRNPKTGEAIAIPEKKTPRFLSGKALSESVSDDK